MSAQDRPARQSVFKRQYPWSPASNAVPSLTIVAPQNSQINILSGQLQCISPPQRIYSMLLLKGQRQGQHIQQITHLRTQADSRCAFFALFFWEQGRTQHSDTSRKAVLKSPIAATYCPCWQQSARGTLVPCCTPSCSVAAPLYNGFAALSPLSEGRFQINKKTWSKQACITKITWKHKACAVEGNTIHSFSHWRTQELAASLKQLVWSVLPEQNRSVAGAAGGARHLCSLFITKKIKKHTFF